MKISKLFHWLYFTVMMLPVFLIPIFAIFVRNENYSSDISVQVEDTQVINFNQIFDSNGTYINNTMYSSNVGGSIVWDDFTVPNSNRNLFDYNPFILNHKYYVKNLLTQPVLEEPYPRVNINGSYITIQPSVDNYYDFIFTATSTRFAFGFASNYVGLTFNNHSTLNVYDLTEMGLENITMQEFDSMFLNYYPFTLNQKMLVTLPNPVIYNDTDLGSQFVYTLYNQVDKYFNFDSVFNFGDLYTWLQFNFFNGNAPLGFFIFWHYLIYWLLVSILWLLFDVLIYVPQLVHRWLDKASLS